MCRYANNVLDSKLGKEGVDNIMLLLNELAVLGVEIDHRMTTRGYLMSTSSRSVNVSALGQGLKGFVRAQSKRLKRQAAQTKHTRHSQKITHSLIDFYTPANQRDNPRLTCANKKIFSLYYRSCR